MRYIDKITDGSKQKFILVSETGEKIDFYLYFMPSQNSWFFNISYGDFTASGLKVSCSPNMLRQWRNKIDFGLACISLNDYDPRTLNAFTSGETQLCLLNSDDVSNIEGVFFTA